MSSTITSRWFPSKSLCSIQCLQHNVICLSNAICSIGQNINLLLRPSVRCPSTRRLRPTLWAQFWTDLHQILEHRFPLTSRRKYFEQPLKWAWPWSPDPLNFWALNANSSKTVKATDFKFDVHVSRGVRTWTLKNFSKRGRSQGHVTPLIFGWPLNVNTAKTVKATDFKFGMHASRDSPGVPLIFFEKGRGQGYVNPEFLVSRADQTHIMHRTATKWAWSARVTKSVISHFLKYFCTLYNNRLFKFYTQLKREECERFIYRMAHKWAWSGNVTKFVILHPLNYLATVDGRVFKFYTELVKRITTTFI